MLTQEQVRYLFDYFPDTGSLIRRVHMRGGNGVGSEVGSEKDNGYGKKYRETSIDKKRYQVHRIIWLHVYGYTPVEIDHIDGNGLNNRLNNLREVTRQGNAKNQRKPKNNTSGVCGVGWCKHFQKWKARIGVNGHDTFLGYFEHKEQAIQARREAEKRFNFHQNHGKDRPL